MAAEVAPDYLSLRCLQTRLAIARAGLLSQQETLQLTSWRVQAGQITVLERGQARTAVEQTRAQIPAIESTLAPTESSLSGLTGQAPGVLCAYLRRRYPGFVSGRGGLHIGWQAWQVDRFGQQVGAGGVVNIAITE